MQLLFSLRFYSPRFLNERNGRMSKGTSVVPRGFPITIRRWEIPKILQFRWTRWLLRPYQRVNCFINMRQAIKWFWDNPHNKLTICWDLRRRRSGLLRTCMYVQLRIRFQMYFHIIILVWIFCTGLSLPSISRPSTHFILAQICFKSRYWPHCFICFITFWFPMATKSKLLKTICNMGSTFCNFSHNLSYIIRIWIFIEVQKIFLHWLVI